MPPDPVAVATEPARNPAVLRDIGELPGPRGLPLVGNLLQLDRDRVHRASSAGGATSGRCSVSASAAAASSALPTMR